MEKRYPPFEFAPVVEGRMYEGFPSRADESKMQPLHTADWTDRAEIAETFEDDIFRELARRLVYVNAPEALADGHRSRLQTWQQNRLHDRKRFEAGRALLVANEELHERS